ncbi:hypothetical protein FEP28_04936 [Burkholderia multivorans]|nr:hypothetical protein [Burkholderia multivorans]MDR9161807.1 hypothetical protein [Burkholderia multivorans]MDR9252313.1 hypothetical protein [Burkholderia multivorans]MDR9263442.1 hypothetical protein [Burkholderia multivorans]MDR9274829.1 hypothetical protein [Burkholderia multivorans]
MDHLFIGLVLCSALLHAIWNAFLHVSDDRLVQLGTMSLPYLAFGVLGTVLLPAPARSAWPYVGASAVLEVAYCFTLVRAYRSGEFGQIYPIARGLSPLLVSVLAFAALDERPTPFGFAGIALVSLGIMSLALRRGFRFSGEGVPYALLTGVFIAAYSICDGIGARASGSARLHRVGVSAVERAAARARLCDARRPESGVRLARHAAPGRDRRHDLARRLRHRDRRVSASAGRDRVRAARDKLDLRGRNRLVRDARAARCAAARRVCARRRGRGADSAVARACACMRTCAARRYAAAVSGRTKARASIASASVANAVAISSSGTHA